MILKSIKLDNIRSYTSQEISFPDGSVLLSGDIGSGKSTILYGVEFALFGIMRGELSGTSLLRNGKNEGSVELKLAVDGKEYVIKRTLKRSKEGVKQSAGYIIQDDMKTELTPVELKTRILEMLGYPKSLVTKSKSLIYRYTVYTPQEQMKHILFDEKENRLDTLRKVFGIDKYKRIRENSSVYIHELKSESKRFEGMIEDLELKRKELEDNGHELAELKVKLDDINPKVIEVKDRRQDKEKELALFEEKIVKLNNMKKQLEVNKAKMTEKKHSMERLVVDIENMDKEILDLKVKVENLEIEEFTKTKEEIEENMTKREEKINYVKSKTAELSEKIKIIKNNLVETKEEVTRKTDLTASMIGKSEELEELQSKVDDKNIIKTRIDDNQKKLIEISLKMKEHETIIKSADELKEKITKIGECPTCLQSVTAEHKHTITCTENEKIDACQSTIEDHNVHKKEIELTNNALKTALENIINKEKLIEKLKAEVTSLQALKDEVVEKQKQYSRLDLERIDIDNALEKLDAFDLETQENALMQEKNMFKRLSEKEHLDEMTRSKIKIREANTITLEESSKLMLEIENENQLLFDSIEESKHIEETFRLKKEGLNAVMEEEKRLEISKATLSKEIEGIEKILKNIEDEVKRKLEVKGNLVKTRQIQQWFEDHFINLMNTMEKQVMMRIYNEFNELFERWFSMLVEQETLTVRLDDEFTPVIEQNGYETELEALSGGEKTAIALAYRLALNKVINDVVGDIKTKDIIILDEPTDGFSSQQLDKLKDVVDQLALKQVIIVSHEAKIESFVDNVVKLSKNEHVTNVI